MRENMEKQNPVMVLVPAYNPDDKLIRYVEKLQGISDAEILVVDDGSRKECQKIFDVLEKVYGVTVLHHECNKGKGRALKTGFTWCLEHRLHCHGVVTADSDGQHSPKDTKRVLETLKGMREGLVLGVRDFNEEQVPWKSRFGNKITSVIFRLLNGKYLCDTQTGLRGITREVLREVLQLSGERYEYEIRMLIYAAKKKLEISEVTIETIYLEENKESHFRPLQDSARIYAVMFSTFLKYMLSSISTSLLDVALFAVLNLWFFSGMNTEANVWMSTVAARVVSSVCNYLLNRGMVFKSTENVTKTMLQYAALVLVQMAASAEFVHIFVRITDGSAVLLKILVDCCLFFVSFWVQQKIIFKETSGM